jgi:hypothetical protein
MYKTLLLPVESGDRASDSQQIFATEIIEFAGYSNRERN